MIGRRGALASIFAAPAAAKAAVEEGGRLAKGGLAWEEVALPSERQRLLPPTVDRLSALREAVDQAITRKFEEDRLRRHLGPIRPQIGERKSWASHFKIDAEVEERMALRFPPLKMMSARELVKAAQEFDCWPQAVREYRKYVRGEKQIEESW